MTNQTDIKSAWEDFIERQAIQAEMSPIIANSWRRSWSRIDLKQPLKFSRLSAEHFLATQISNFDFISIARPVMEDAYQCIENSETVIMLINSAGYLLELLGDQVMLDELNELGINQGALLSEENIGTNALGLALIEQISIQVIGAEHYRPQLHNFASAAAPIFDLSGQTIGVLGLFTSIKNYHRHSFGLIAMGAHSIEGQRQSDHLLAEQNSQLAELNTILSLVTNGILVWNSEDILIHANASTGNILGQSAQAFVGKRVDEIFSVSPFFAQAIQKHETLNDVEISVTHDKQVTNCIASLYFVFNYKNVLQWGILTLKPEKDIRKLVQRQVGANADLTLDDIPGDSIQMKRVRNFVRSAADAGASILIRGEVGTGKNVLANAIHNTSRRREGPFVIFSCLSIPNELIINELLGYDENFDPTRLRSQPSKFELAQGGSIFFQDVDALPLEAQSVLINVLELGFTQRLGSQLPIDVDVRVTHPRRLDRVP
jgi:transcriptional activator for dhaKLM operon